MRNRAKCKLCDTIIESRNGKDILYCKCGSLGICEDEKGPRLFVKPTSDFIRVDDEGNELKILEENEEKITRNNQIEMLDEMIKNIEKLPSNAMTTYINHYDFGAALLLISSILKTRDIT